MKTTLTSIASVIDAASTMRRVYRESRCACACGCGGTWRKTVGGTIADKPSIWMGCDRRNGSSVGGGLTGEACHVARAVLTACERLGLDIDDVCESENKRECCVSFVCGPLALDFEREQLEVVVATWGTTALGRIDPDKYLAGRRLTQRGIDIADVREGIWEPVAI
jgi:hypothetical protein